LKRAALFCLALLISAGASAKDVAGSKDHPLVGRYAGATIVNYSSRDFNKATLLTATIDGVAATQEGALRPAPEWLAVQGKDVQIRYEGPEGRSALEVIENLKASLTAKGFVPLFECADAECFSGSSKDTYLLGWAVDGAQQNGRYADHANYLLAALDGPQGKVYASILVGEAGSGLTEFVHVVEVKAMETGKVVFVDASAMQKSIDASGHVSLYGILFDTDRDTLRPESKPTLDEIARLLAAHPDLKLVVAGHTDNQGAFDYNIDLSRRRAASVVAALVLGYGVARERLVPFGAGMAAPTASNATEDGRQKNRRVELVAR
jgi:OmpA-OmpF porin, OOP family